MNSQKNKTKIAFVLVVLLILFTGCRKGHEEVIGKELAINTLFLRDGKLSNNNVFIPGQSITIHSSVNDFETKGLNLDLRIDFLVLDTNNKVIEDRSQYDYVAKEKLSTLEDYYFVDYRFDTFDLDEGDYSVKVNVKDEISEKTLEDKTIFKLRFPDELTVLGPILSGEDNKVRKNDVYSVGDEIKFYIRVLGMKNSFINGKYKISLKGDIVITDDKGNRVDYSIDAVEHTEENDRPVKYFAGNFNIDSSKYDAGTYQILMRINDLESGETKYAQKRFVLI